MIIGLSTVSRKISFQSLIIGLIRVRRLRLIIVTMLLDIKVG